MLTNHMYLIYMYKLDLALNNLQWLICHKTRPNQTKPNLIVQWFTSLTEVLGLHMLRLMGEFIIIVFLVINLII